jgi:hypothetical protein
MVEVVVALCKQATRKRVYYAQVDINPVKNGDGIPSPGVTRADAGGAS